MPYALNENEPLRAPTTQDWAAAICGYVGEAYGMAAFEIAELIGATAAALAAEGFDPNPPHAALPLRVREHIASAAELTRALSADATRAARELLDEPLYVDPGVWADFACRYLEYSEALSATQGLLVWRRLAEVFASFDLARRAVVYLSVPMQQALPLDDVRPVFDVTAVL